MFSIDVSDKAVLAALDALCGSASNPAPALHAIGEEFQRQTKNAFAVSASPDGTPWAPNSSATLSKLQAGLGKSYRKKAGGLNTKGQARIAGKKPLIGETGSLRGQFVIRVANGVLEFGSSMEYAAMQQFGGTQAAFPHLWGDIPARPFLPITAGGQLMEPARRAVVDIVQEHLLGRT